MKNRNLVIRNNDSLSNTPVERIIKDAGDNPQIAIAQKVVDKVMAKNDTWMSKILPSEEIKARREKDTALINQALGDRNEMYRILRQTEILAFKEAANVFITHLMVEAKSGLAVKLTHAINQVAGHFEVETDSFYERLERMYEKAHSRQGGLAKKLQEQTEIEIDTQMDIFQQLKDDLLQQLKEIKDNLLK